MYIIFEGLKNNTLRLLLQINILSTFTQFQRFDTYKNKTSMSLLQIKNKFSSAS